MNTFEVNGITCTAREFDFNALVEFDNYGISIQDVADKPFAFIRAYVAYCMHTDLEEAGKAINDHVVSGGKLDQIFEVINTEMEKSGFFHALSNEPKEVPKRTTTGTKKAR